ncbi:DUF6338 family protein [Pseudoalteromonas distincta]|uniref:DUF6338 family protein n=1 Tax=Pseudoalteromonas distincta TaxID=77608 RepID=UPI0039EA7BBB
MNVWESDKLILFILFVIPGFIAMKFYSMLVAPDAYRDSSKQLVDAIAYSCFNYAIPFPIILYFEKIKLIDSSPNGYIFFYFFLILIFPIVLTYIWHKIRSCPRLRQKVTHPAGKPWDFIFSKQNKTYFIKVTLKDGKVVGGFYGENSFSSSSPNPEQLFLEQTWIISDKGKFERPKNDSAGIIILTNEVSHIEFRHGVINGK